MSTLAFDVAAVRSRFPSLAGRTIFLDGPGGTQVPDSVIEAMARCLREANANLGGPFETSRRADGIVADAHQAAARFLGASVDEVGFGHNMTTLNFALSRTLGRELAAGDEIVVTRLDHDDLERQLSPRTRVVAFPWASNAVGTITPVTRVAELAHEAGALAWVDAVHYAPHGPIDVVAAGVDVVVCSPYKFFGPHLGLFYGRREVLERWRPYKVRPSADEPVAHRFETGTLAHEALAGFSAAVEYVESIGWDAIQAYERELGQRFLDSLSNGYRLYGIPTMAGRTPTFALTHPRQSPEELATALGQRDIAAWWGNYYAVEIMERLGLADGALRIGFVHYNTADEVDRVLAALEELA
jgi:selenocysteine lyase/cysteine desulfurase